MDNERYCTAPDDVFELKDKLIEEFFPELKSAHIEILIDSKKKIQGGRLTLAYIKPANELIKYFTQDEVASGYGFDYIMFINKKALEVINEKDLIRLVRHELRHCFHDIEKTNPWKVIDHDIKDFKAEIRLNSDDLDWGDRLAEKVQLMYEQEKEAKKDEW